jgi:alkylation response protein AidB-like acyl-CoA dehydrogenase
MLLELTDDQEFFRQTTAKFLEDQVPVAELRRLRHDPAGFDARYWKRGAELGWTSLLVSEQHGGGSVSGQGLIDLSVIAYEFGRRAAPGPLAATNVVAAALSEHGRSVDDILSGDAIGTWCYGDRLGQPPVEIRVDGTEVVLNGVVHPVESGGRARHLLVTGRTGDGLTQVVVPAEAVGVLIEPMGTVDLTRRFSLIRLNDVRIPATAVLGEIGGAAADVERQLQLAIVILVAESVGAMQSAFDMTVEWAFDRYTFGRPLASYQALKHRFADAKSWLEGAHAISDAAAAAVSSSSREAPELVSAAKAFVGHYGNELTHECVQLHGGIGVTFEHDLHLFHRRVTINRTLCGTPAEHRQRLADVILGAV